MAEEADKIELKKVLRPFHVWALGVGIVLVGEFMGWNFTIAKGGPIASLLACWFIGVLYIVLVLVCSEMGSAMPKAGGPYEWTKQLVGPMAAWIVGLAVALEYIMLESADSLVIGALMEDVSGGESIFFFWVLLTVCVLSLLNYRGVFLTLTTNFIITFTAYVTIFILFFYTRPFTEGSILDMTLPVRSITGYDITLPYGYVGVLAALQYGIWYYLGIEGATMSAEECQMPGRAVPLGTVAGMTTLLVGATLTWFLATRLVDWTIMRESPYPLYDAALATGSTAIIGALAIGTLFSCLASANGCINDTSRSWFAMARDGFVNEWWAGVHPKYKTPYRGVLLTMPLAVVFGFSGLLDQVIAFSISSGLMVYFIIAIASILFRKRWPLGTIPREYVSPWFPLPSLTLLVLAYLTMISFFFGYGVNLAAALTFYLVAAAYYVFYSKKRVERHAQMFVFDFPVPADRPDIKDRRHEFREVEDMGEVFA
ncbi:MAG: APC family permease [Methermicoccaceae archaeon]